MDKTQIVILGGGFGGVYALKNLHHRFHNTKKAKITLLNEKNYFLFTPLLHEVATGGVGAQNIIEPLKKLFECEAMSVHTGLAQKINLKERVVETSSGELKYDYLIIATGAETNFYNIKGAEENCFTLKSLDDAIRLKNHFIQTINKASFLKDREKRKQILRFVVIGGGPTGVELVSEMQEFLKGSFSKYYQKDLIEDISIILIQKSPELLPNFPKVLREKALLSLKEKGIEVMLYTSVSEVKKDSIVLSNGKNLKTNTAIWLAGVKPVNIAFDPEIVLSKEGKIKVNKFLQMEGNENIYAIGDGAEIEDENGKAVPMLAQVAVKEAEFVAENVERDIKRKKPLPFHFKNSGSLISLGKWKAVGEIRGRILSGPFAWWVWRTVYLFKLLSWQKKLKVALDWTLNLFSARDISEL